MKGQRIRLRALQYTVAGVAAVALVVQAMACGCSRSSAPTPAPTPAPLPEKAPPPVKVWPGFTAHSICLEKTLEFEQIPGEVPDPVDESVRGILTGMGIRVVDVGSACDATLSLTMRGEAFCSSYANWTIRCCTGGQVTGEVRLVADGQQTFAAPISAEDPLSEEAEARWCKAHPEPKDYPFRDLWFVPTLDILGRIWGSPALVWALDQEVKGGRGVVTDKLWELDPSDELTMALIYALHEQNEIWPEKALQVVELLAPETRAAIPYLAQIAGDETHALRFSAAHCLGVFGPEAMESVPAPIRQLEITQDRNQGWAYEALKKITGNDFREDAAAWRKWWNSGASK